MYGCIHILRRKTPKPVFEVYKDAAGKWRWKLKAPNGEIIASSSKGYETKVDCLKRIHALDLLIPIATTSVTDETREMQVLGYVKQVFLSHSSYDKEMIDLIQLAFEVTPVKPYFARFEKAGKNPADKIIHEIDNSDALFALLTSNVFAKTETLFWVLFEIGIAKGKDKPIHVWIGEECDVPEFIKYITDYEKFNPKEFKDRHRAVREMITIALKL